MLSGRGMGGSTCLSGDCFEESREGKCHDSCGGREMGYWDLFGSCRADGMEDSAYGLALRTVLKCTGART